MLGITTPDAIAVGTLIIALLAAWRGGAAGDAAKKVAPPPPTPMSLGMASFADTAIMTKLVEVLARLALAAEERNRREEEQDQIDEKMDRAELLRIARELRAGRLPPP